MNSKDTQKIINNVYYYTYTTLSVVFILGMLGGIVFWGCYSRT